MANEIAAFLAVSVVVIVTAIKLLRAAYLVFPSVRGAVARDPRLGRAARARAVSPFRG